LCRVWMAALGVGEALGGGQLVVVASAGASGAQRPGGVVGCGEDLGVSEAFGQA
jgi:hypothetical protein